MATEVIYLALGEQKSSQSFSLLFSILNIFREIVDSLERAEPRHDLRLFYVQLNANSLLLSECISPIRKLGSTTELERLTRPILNSFSSLLQCSVIPEYETAIPSGTPFPRLTALEHFWGLPGSREEKIKDVEQCVDFNCEERRDEIILLLRGGIATLRVRCPDGSTDDREEYRPPRKKRRRPASSVWDAANTACKALLACAKNCSSVHSHDYAARLRLATHNKRVNDDYAFETFFTMSPTPFPWQEALIRVILSSTSQKTQSSVRFSLPLEKCVTSSRQAVRPRVVVKRLCEQIAKMRQLPLMRMNLKVEQGKLWKEQSSRSNHPINRSDPAVSLEDIISSCPTNLTEKVKRVLAVQLAYSVLHLRGTPWLHTDHFTASNILFFRRASALPLKPYIHIELQHSSHDTTNITEGVECSSPEIDPDDFPSHPYPELIMLAIMLMELYMKRPIQELAEQGGMELHCWDNLDGNTRYAAAVAAFEFFKTEFPDKYRGSVDKCLDPNIGFDESDQELDDNGLKNVIYEDIVRPLEDELDSGFGSTLSVENLDEVAQTFDLSTWGQMNNASILSASTNTSQVFGSHPSSPGSPYVHLPLNHTHSGLDEEHNPRMHRQNMAKSIPGSDYMNCFRHESYTVGWICALPKEMAASQAMLDEVHPSLPQDACDPNSYSLGRIGIHNVVIACLPAGVTGTISAARVANQMLSTFKSIRFGLMVGIGGGVPGSKDIRLGDIVVAEPHGTFPGVIQYDFGKTVEQRKFLRTGSLNRPPDILLTAVSRLRANHYQAEPQLNHYLREMLQQYPELSAEFSHPGMDRDLLFDYNYDHNPDGDNDSCEKCDPTRQISRQPRKSSDPHIHYGLIASGNQVMRHGVTREHLRKDLDILCFEMEAAGLMDIFPCLVIRGISDYSDSHKADAWQGYAAAVAAAYAKELLGVVSGG